MSTADDRHIVWLRKLVNVRSMGFANDPGNQAIALEIAARLEADAKRIEELTQDLDHADASLREWMELE